MAEVLERNFDTLPDQVSNAFLLSYSRPANKQEISRGVQFIREFDPGDPPASASSASLKGNPFLTHLRPSHRSDRDRGFSPACISDRIIVVLELLSSASVLQSLSMVSRSSLILSGVVILGASYVKVIAS